MSPFGHMRTLDLAIVQMRPRKGDYAANLARIGDLLSRIDSLEPRPQVVQFPETAVTGYFVEGGVRDLAVTAGELARDLDAAYRAAVAAPGPIGTACKRDLECTNDLCNWKLTTCSEPAPAGTPCRRHKECASGVCGPSSICE